MILNLFRKESVLWCIKIEIFIYACLKNKVCCPKLYSQGFLFKPKPLLACVNQNTFCVKSFGLTDSCHIHLKTFFQSDTLLYIRDGFIAQPPVDRRLPPVGPCWANYQQ